MTKHTKMPGGIANGMRVAGAAAVLIGSFALTACPKKSDDPAPPACQTNNTADVSFRNSTVNNFTYRIIWDGSNIGLLAPGQSGLGRSVSAGTPHTLVFQNNANGANACLPGNPNLAQCTSNVFFCTG